MSKRDLNIVFMGTPDFAVPSLDIIVKNGYNVVAVVTAPDKPAGRGKKIQSSAIKKYALENNLKVLQPEKLKAPEFEAELRALNTNLMVVVAFRMLPEAIWSLPEFGTFNLHASLLPQYRGAAPINWAVINGEKETGATTFFIEKEIDTGKIIDQFKTPIGENENVGDVHDRLMTEGARLVLKTVQAVEKNEIKAKPQTELITQDIALKPAPKIFKDDCKIDWNKDINTIYNLIRGLSPYPAAWCELMKGETTTICKIFETEKIIQDHQTPIGNIISDGKKELKIAVSGGHIKVNSLQLAGKKRMNTEDFLRGFQGIEEYSAK